MADSSRWDLHLCVCPHPAAVPGLCLMNFVQEQRPAPVLSSRAACTRQKIATLLSEPLLKLACSASCLITLHYTCFVQGRPLFTCQCRCFAATAHLAVAPGFCKCELLISEPAVAASMLMALCAVVLCHVKVGSAEGAGHGLLSCLLQARNRETATCAPVLFTPHTGWSCIMKPAPGYISVM